VDGTTQMLGGAFLIHKKTPKEEKGYQKKHSGGKKKRNWGHKPQKTTCTTGGHPVASTRTKEKSSRRGRKEGAHKKEKEKVPRALIRAVEKIIFTQERHDHRVKKKRTTRKQKKTLEY